MAISSKGAFSFVTEGIKHIVGLVRSSDGVIIEIARAFHNGGNAVVNIPFQHKLIHEGNTYCAGHLAESVANDATMELLVKVGAAKDAHMQIEVAAGGDCYVALFEATTTSNDGTGLTERNKVRGITTDVDVSATTVLHTPTITGDGNQLGPTRFIPGGRVATASGGTGASREEWVLKTSTNYLVRVTNKAGSAKTLAAYLEWYDAPPITSKDQV